MPKVYSKKDKVYPADAVYVGRPTRWGNPYSIGRDGTREEVIEKFRWLAEEPSFSQVIRDNLRGKDLLCWCAPEACHADVLLEIANAD